MAGKDKHFPQKHKRTEMKKEGKRNGYHTKFGIPLCGTTAKALEERIQKKKKREREREREREKEKKGIEKVRRRADDGNGWLF